MTRLLDFDALVAAEVAEPPVLRVHGEDIVLPAEKPALFALLLDWLASDEARAQEPEDRLRPVFDVMVGAGRFDAWLDGGMSFESFGRLLKLMRDAYQEDDEGEAEAPEAGASRSKTSGSSGASSKRTGSASTKRTSRQRSKAG